MTQPQPDPTSGAALNGTPANHRGRNRGKGRTPRVVPPYGREDVADALADISEHIRAQSTDLPPAEWQLLDLPFKKKFPGLFVSDMAAAARVLIGFLWLPLVGIGSLIGLLWSYPLAERAQAGNGTTVAVHWLGPDFHATPTTAVLLAMAFAASSGSVVQAAVVFAMRAGSQTLERGYEAWYYLRPVTSFLLGPLFGLATIGGLSAITSGSGAGARLSLPAVVTAGALAGLFTDRVLQQMQRILGATDPDKHASQQATPWTASSSPPPSPSETPVTTTPVEVRVSGSSKPAGKKTKKSGPAHVKRVSMGQKKLAPAAVDEPETPGSPTP